jgi:predicted O-methyltransferase YrrM
LPTRTAANVARGQHSRSPSRVGHRMDKNAKRAIIAGGHSLRNLFKRLASRALEAFGLAVAPAVGFIARRGCGTQHFLRKGFLPVPVHYYQPVFDPNTVPDSVWQRRHDLPGIEFNEQSQLAVLREFGKFGEECRWPERATGGYYAQNGSFGYSSAAVLHAAVRYFTPRQVIEVGAGMSTLVLTSALKTNDKGVLTTIDPNPREAVRDLPERCRIVSKPVEHIPLETFEALERDDLLFIDSSHVVRTGGDVNYLYLDVLPRLKSGVIVHIHDIQLPYEYFKAYSSRRDAPRLFWTEQYLLQAFLTHNPKWEILLAGYWLQRERAEQFQVAFPLWRPERHRLTTSFYIRARA